MFKVTTRSEAVIRQVYRSRVLERFVTFDVAGLDRVRSDALRDEILGRFTTQDGHGKMTRAGRFADLDPIAVGYLERGRRNVIHDVGVSSGVTSCELHDAIARAGDVDFDFFVSDKYNRYSSRGSLVRRLYDADGRLLSGSIFGLVADPRASAAFMGSRLLFGALRAYDERLHAGDDSRTTTIDMFAPRARDYLRDGKLRLLPYDVWVGGERERFTYVRCMNVLNVGWWFSDAQVDRGLRSVVSSLQPGGVLQLGRTRDLDGQNDASFFRKQGDSLVLLSHHHAGTETMALLQRAGLLAP
jgi:hypothetical protein